MQEGLRKRFPELVAFFSALGFLTLLAELLLTGHTEGIQALAPLGAGMGALATLAGLGLKAGRPWAIGLLLLLGGLGLVGLLQHTEEALEAQGPAEVRLVGEEGEAYPAYLGLSEEEEEEVDGENLPPPLAPLALSGLGLLGALALYVRTP